MLRRFAASGPWTWGFASPAPRCGPRGTDSVDPSPHLPPARVRPVPRDRDRRRGGHRRLPPDRARRRPPLQARAALRVPAPAERRDEGLGQPAAARDRPLPDRALRQEARAPAGAQSAVRVVVAGGAARRLSRRRGPALAGPRAQGSRAGRLGRGRHIPQRRGAALDAARRDPPPQPASCCAPRPRPPPPGSASTRRSLRSTSWTPAGRWRSRSTAGRWPAISAAAASSARPASSCRPGSSGTAGTARTRPRGPLQAAPTSRWHEGS